MLRINDKVQICQQDDEFKLRKQFELIEEIIKNDLIIKCIQISKIQKCQNRINNYECININLNLNNNVTGYNRDIMQMNRQREQRESKVIYSLPRTQPTLSSSSKSRNKTSTKIQYKNVDTCPQVSVFSTDDYAQQTNSHPKSLKQPYSNHKQTHKQDKQQIYTHFMNIDYGKLSKPYQQKLKHFNLNNQLQQNKSITHKPNKLQSSELYNQQLDKSVKKQIDLSNDLSLFLSTKKFNNLKQYTFNQNQNQTLLNYTQKQAIQPPIHSLLTHKKAFSTQKIPKPNNPQSGIKLIDGSKLINDKIKKRNRIISVRAYQSSNNVSILIKPQMPKIKQSLNKQLVNQQSSKKFSDTPKLKQRVMELMEHDKLISDRLISDRLVSDRSDKKISHSRIIKTFNPTAGLQTKIISYPDLSEVFRLKESRKKIN